MDSHSRLTRRSALKKLCAGAALIGSSALAHRNIAAEPAMADATGHQPFALPKLDYAYEALEPHIDARTMEIHHNRHHRAYIDNANRALSDQPALQKLSGEQLLASLATVPESIRTAVRNNVGGHVNHTFFWKVIGPAAGGRPTSELAAAINRDFGSLDAFKSQFTDAAMKRFGSGWAWLACRDGKLSVVSTANQDSPLTDGVAPVLGVDVWEHAYYLKYQNRRADYLEAFWNVVNWPQVAANFAKAGNRR
jgi:Fe-Mn family superoxide dismutase